MDLGDVDKGIMFVGKLDTLADVRINILDLCTQARSRKAFYHKKYKIEFFTRKASNDGVYKSRILVNIVLGKNFNISLKRTISRDIQKKVITGGFGGVLQNTKVKNLQKSKINFKVKTM